LECGELTSTENEFIVEEEGTALVWRDYTHTRLACLVVARVGFRQVYFSVLNRLGHHFRLVLIHIGRAIFHIYCALLLR